MNRETIISTLQSYFQHNAVTYDISLAFLYGSYACGEPKVESDVDVAVLLTHEVIEEKAFEIINNLTLELTNLLKTEVNVLYIDAELSKPMLHYNVIIHSIPVFIRDFTRYADIRMKAISQMEDFGIFGIKWQTEIVQKRLEALSHA